MLAGVTGNFAHGRKVTFFQAFFVNGVQGLSLLPF